MSFKETFTIRGMQLQGTPGPDAFVQIQLIPESGPPFPATIIVKQKDLESLQLSIGKRITISISKTE